LERSPAHQERSCGRSFPLLYLSEKHSPVLDWDQHSATRIAGCSSGATPDRKDVSGADRAPEARLSRSAYEAGPSIFSRGGLCRQWCRAAVAVQRKPSFRIDPTVPGPQSPICLERSPHSRGRDWPSRPQRPGPSPVQCPGRLPATTDGLHAGRFCDCQLFGFSLVRLGTSSISI